MSKSRRPDTSHRPTYVLPQEKPLWGGPYEEGLTQSLLQEFQVCRHRFWLHVVSGLIDDEFNEAIEFGNIWHEAEEARAGGATVQKSLRTGILYATRLEKEWQSYRWEIGQMVSRFKVMWPRYCAHWDNHRFDKKLEPCLQEEVFNVPYTLADGRVLRIKGKFDAVHYLGLKGGKWEYWLQENKTKSRVDTSGILHTLPYNLQTCFYMIALNQYIKEWNLEPYKVGGVLYNVVLRTSHRQGKKESSSAFLKRYASIIEKEPHKFFMRWECAIEQHDLDKFIYCTLNNLLTQLCDWWDWVSSPEGLADPFANPIHYRTPWGVYNSLFGGFQGDYYRHLTTGTDVSLRQATTLFPEL